jgi:hypothetical protein
VKNLVPQNGTYPIPFVHIIVVVQHMVLFDFLKPSAFKISVVHRIVHHVVDQIAQYEPREKGVEALLWKNKVNKK